MCVYMCIFIMWLYNNTTPGKNYGISTLYNERFSFVVFNRLSTFEGYLILKPLLFKNSSGTI